jgi:hypothetical protein
MAGGINERQLHLITPAMELLLARLEVALPSHPVGGQLAGQIPASLEDAQVTNHGLHRHNNLRQGRG